MGPAESISSHRYLVVCYRCLMAAHSFRFPNVINSFAACVEIGGDCAGTVVGIMNFPTPGILVAGALLWVRMDVTKRVAG